MRLLGWTCIFGILGMVMAANSVVPDWCGETSYTAYKCQTTVVR